MDSIERKKTKPYNINEKEILEIVAAKGSYLSSISENLEEVPPHKESSSRAESKKTITDEEVKKYIEAGIFEEMLARADSLSAQVDRLYEKNREKKPGE